MSKLPLSKRGALLAETIGKRIVFLDGGMGTLIQRRGLTEADFRKGDARLEKTAGELRGDGRRSMGIGLSVCMSIVRAHGGTMKAKNRATGGACVSFVLPMGEE